MQDINVYDDVWKRIHRVKFAMLTTIDAEGNLTARPMTTVQKDFAGTIWFFTSKAAPASLDIAKNPSVGLQYSEPKDDLYVSLSGDARLEFDRARMEALWTPPVKVYFPRGLDDPEIALMRIDVHLAEYWDVQESKPVQLYKMAKAAIQGERPHDLGEHRTVTM